METNTTYYVSVTEILNSRHMSRDGRMPDTLLLESGENVYRINLMAFLIDLNENTLLVDDSTGRIAVRFFDNKSTERFKLGDLLQIIGRVKEFEGEKYITADIISNLDPAWIKVRTFELRNRRKIKVTVGPVERHSESDKTQSDEETICKTIQSLDKGEGVPVEQVVEKLPGDRTREIINKMLEKGIIFMPRSGRLKILK